MENLSLMFAPLFSSKLMIVLVFGTLFGLILGVLPGLGPTTGGALILPFTMTLDPLSAIVLLTAIYCSATYGGAITAVLINTPELLQLQQPVLMDIHSLKKVRRVGL